MSPKVDAGSGIVVRRVAVQVPEPSTKSEFLPPVNASHSTGGF